MNCGEVGSKEDEINKRRRDGDVKWSKEGGEMRGARGRNWRMKTRKKGSEGRTRRVFVSMCAEALMTGWKIKSLQLCLKLMLTYWEQADLLMSNTSGDSLWRIIRVIIIHPVGIMNVCTKCHGKLSKSRWDISCIITNATLVETLGFNLWDPWISESLHRSRWCDVSVEKWKLEKDSHRITKVQRVHHQGTMSVCTKFNSNPSNSQKPKIPSQENFGGTTKVSRVYLLGSMSSYI